MLQNVARKLSVLYINIYIQDNVHVGKKTIIKVNSNCYGHVGSVVLLRLRQLDSTLSKKRTIKYKSCV